MATNTRTTKGTGKIRFNVTLTTDANRALKTIAKEERRSKSNMLEMLIRAERDRAELKQAA